jgi:plastocyanin
MSDTQRITITDSSVNTVTVQPGHKIRWTNDASVSVTLTNLPSILSPTPPGAELTLAVGETSGKYTVNGSPGSYTYDISPTGPAALPRTGTIDIG